MVSTELVTTAAGTADRHAQAFKLKMKGFSASQIARICKVDERTVYRWWKKHAQEYADTIKTESPLNVIAEHIAFFEELERQALEDAQLASGHRDRQVHRAQAMKARQSIIDLQAKVGVIPTAASQLYVAVDDIASAAVSQPNKPCTREEAIDKLAHLLLHERRMPDFSDEDD